MSALILWFVGGCLLGVWLADAAERRATRRLFAVLPIRPPIVDHAPPTRAELNAGIHP